MKPHYTFKLPSILDSVAIGLSGACLIHCLALPLALAVFPLLSVTLIDHEAFHQIVLIAVLPTTAIALGIGFTRHREKTVALLGAVGVAALVFAAFALHSLHAHHLETWVTVAGGITLALAHVGNFRGCRHADHIGGGLKRYDTG